MVGNERAPEIEYFVSLKTKRYRHGLKTEINFVAKLQEVTNISRKLIVRGYEQMMIGGYKWVVLVKLFIKFVFQSVIQPYFQFRFNLYLCKTQNLNAKFGIQLTKQLYHHQDVI